MTSVIASNTKSWHYFKHDFQLIDLHTQLGRPSSYSESVKIKPSGSKRAALVVPSVLRIAATEITLLLLNYRSKAKAYIQQVLRPVKKK